MPKKLEPVSIDDQYFVIVQDPDEATYNIKLLPVFDRYLSRDKMLMPREAIDLVANEADANWPIFVLDGYHLAAAIADYLDKGELGIFGRCFGKRSGWSKSSNSAEEFLAEFNSEYYRDKVLAAKAANIMHTIEQLQWNRAKYIKTIEETDTDIAKLQSALEALKEERK